MTTRILDQVKKIECDVVTREENVALPALDEL